ncbi:MAG: chromosome segregation protein SMC [Halobacteria archaeon]|nr:chromosome segregation protein SMC [Halobacteria archaeon]
MHIKELRVDGFKSFGRRTEVPFYEGFTTISGPNGSGKSNLIDSILFALGLARTRGMRAQKLPDLLYNPPDGEPAREASVEVVLDNSDSTLSEDEIREACGEVKHPDEIVIKRRIKKTENDYYSYYYINGRSVNLSDIQDLLANAGITPEGYNVVMQGDVTNIIQMSSTERRGIVEEAAGTAEFDEKKEQAFDEMETVEERIENVELVLDELDDRLDELEKERDEALEYKELKEEKEEYESLLSAAKLRETETEIDEVRDDIDDEISRKEELEDELEEANDRVAELKEELQELNDEINRKGEEERLELKAEIEEVRGKISSREERIDDAEEALDDLQTERREAFVEADKAREKIDDIEDEIRDVKARKSSLKADLASKKSDLEEIEEEIDEVEGEYSEVREELEERKQEVEELRDEKNELQREKDRLLDEARRRSREIDEVEGEIEDAEEELEDAKKERDEVEKELQKAEKNLDELQDVKSDLRDEKAELQEKIEEIDEKLRKKQEEYRDAESRTSSGSSSYGRAVSAVLNSDIEGVHGTVADLGSVSQEYATACETAAGGRMAQVVVDDDEVGQRCIEYLKKRNSGRATFLPLNEMHRNSLSSKPLSRDGVIDYAYNLVEFDPEYEGVFSYVFGDTLVVEDIETARSMMGDYRLVTLEGDLVEKSGAMTGGSKRESRYSFGSKGAVESYVTNSRRSTNVSTTSARGSTTRAPRSRGTRAGMTTSTTRRRSLRNVLRRNGSVSTRFRRRSPRRVIGWRR